MHWARYDACPLIPVTSSHMMIVDIEECVGCGDYCDMKAGRDVHICKLLQIDKM